MTNVATFLGKRFGRVVLMLWAVITVVFVLFRVVPSDPTSMYLQSGLSAEVRQRILESYGLSQPLHEQYVVYLQELLLEFNLGHSFYYKQPVGEIIVPRFFNTLILMVPTFTLILVSTYLVGAYLGWRSGEKIDRVGSIFFMSMRALPHFILGLFLLMIFSYWLDILPLGGTAPLGEPQNITFGRLLDSSLYYYAALPFVTIFLHWFADSFLLMRGNIVTQKSKEYVRMLRIKGLPESKVRSHAAKNSRLPMVTYASTLVNVAFSGVVLVEIVFRWPGIGREIVNATLRQDYPVAQAAFLIIATAIIVANFVIDLLYGYLDPRISYGRE